MPAERRTDPAYTDYLGFARRIGGLAAAHGSLEAWSIDNVFNDGALFTPAYLASITEAARKEGPELLFIPVVYYPNIGSPAFGERAAYFDGIQLYYTHFPEGGSDESAVLLPMLDDVRKSFGGLVILGIYATPCSTSAAYVEQLINLAKEHTDGVMIYTMDQEGEKLEVIRKAFGG